MSKSTRQKPRFFAASTELRLGIISLSAADFREEIQHMHKTLRLGVGDALELADGRGNVAQGKILELTRAQLQIEITALHASPVKGPQIYLVQSILKGQRMDWLLEKITELSLSGVIPIETVYSGEELATVEKRRARWDRLLIAAFKQSLIPKMPVIADALALDTFLKQRQPEDFCVLLHPSESAPPLWHLLSKAPLAANSRWFFICGPEGGFSEKEVLQFSECGIPSAHLGPSRLRAETAALTACVLAKQYEFAHTPRGE